MGRVPKADASSPLDSLLKSFNAAVASGRARLAQAYDELERGYLEYDRKLPKSRGRVPFGRWATESIGQSHLLCVLEAKFGPHWQSIGAKNGEQTYRRKAATSLGICSHLYLYLWFGEAAVASRTAWKGIAALDIGVEAFFQAVISRRACRSKSPRHYLHARITSKEVIAAKTQLSRPSSSLERNSADGRPATSDIEEANTESNKKTSTTKTASDPEAEPTRTTEPSRPKAHLQIQQTPSDRAERYGEDEGQSQDEDESQAITSCCHLQSDKTQPRISKLGPAVDAGFEEDSLAMRDCRTQPASGAEGAQETQVGLASTNTGSTGDSGAIVIVPGNLPTFSGVSARQTRSASEDDDSAIFMGDETSQINMSQEGSCAGNLTPESVGKRGNPAAQSGSKGERSDKGHEVDRLQKAAASKGEPSISDMTDAMEKSIREGIQTLQRVQSRMSDFAMEDAKAKEDIEADGREMFRLRAKLLERADHLIDAAEDIDSTERSEDPLMTPRIADSVENQLIAVGVHKRKRTGDQRDIRSKRARQVVRLEKVGDKVSELWRALCELEEFD